MRLFVLPSKRLARLQRGNAKALTDLEQKAGVEIFIQADSDGESTIEIDGDSEKEWLAEQALKAIDLGFEPKHAFKIFNDDYYLEEVDLGLSMRGKDSAVARVKARIIGTGGKVKKKVEELSEAYLALSDDQRVGIIGEFDEVKAAKEAVIRIIEGSQHASVFDYLKKEKDLRKSRRLGAAV